MDELRSLKKENAELKARNAKLYRDCVSFAKKIKANENLELRISELEAENEELKSEITRLASSEALPEYDEEIEIDIQPDDEEEIEEEVVEEIEEIEEDEIEEKIEIELGAKNNPPQPEIDPNEAPKNHSKHKHSPVRTFFRTIFWIFLIFSLLVGIVSGVAYLFSNSFKDYSVAGYRFATVKNNLMAPEVDDDDVILIKYCDLEGIPLDSLVLTTKEKAGVAAMKSVDIVNGEKLATVKDCEGEYTVNENQFYGRVMFTIPYLGSVVAYACANQYQYLGIVVGANLLFIILLVIFPSNKARAPKLGKDYTVDDFTI